MIFKPFLHIYLNNKDRKQGMSDYMNEASLEFPLILTKRSDSIYKKIDSELPPIISYHITRKELITKSDFLVKNKYHIRLKTKYELMSALKKKTLSVIKNNT